MRGGTANALRSWALPILGFADPGLCRSWALPILGFGDPGLCRSSALLLPVRIFSPIPLLLGPPVAKALPFSRNVANVVGGFPCVDRSDELGHFASTFQRKSVAVGGLSWMMLQALAQVGECDASLRVAFELVGQGAKRTEQLAAQLGA